MPRDRLLDDDDNNDDAPPQNQRDTVTPAGNPLPDVVHLTVLSIDDDDDNAVHAAAADASTTIRWLNPRGRLVIVGDVHGCKDALERLLHAADFRDGVDNLVLTGDLVTKGADSVAVVERLMALGALCARGNHDDLCVAAARTAGGVDEGAPQPSPDYIPGLRDKHLQWLAALPFTLRLPAYRVTVAHAGLVPGVGRKAQALRDVTRMRELVAVGKDDESEENKRRQKKRWRAVEAHEPGSVPWAPEWRGPGHVFFGHDSAMGLQRQRAATGLDTGCVYGGRLTCAVLPSLEELAATEKRRRRRRWWWWRRARVSVVLRLWCCGVGEAAADLQQLPRTPRLERDLRGRIVSVPGASPPPTPPPPLGREGRA
jgi:hypothetical protein